MRNFHTKRPIKNMHEPEDQANSNPQCQSAIEKWQLGMNRLKRAEAEPELLGSAMLSLHGALEDQFRHTLASLRQLSAPERFRVKDVSQVQWRELCDLMQKYGGLSDRDVKYIMKMNSLRIDAGHGGEFRGTYQDVAAYADFIKGWLGLTENTTAQVSRSSINRCPRCQSMNIKSLEVIHHQGISVVERRLGKAETRQSGLSLRAAPPKKKGSGSALVWFCGVFFLGFPVVGAIGKVVVPALESIPLIGGLLGGIATFVCLAVLFLGLVYPYYRVWKFNKTQHPRLMEEWRRTFMCEQCAHTFPLDTLS
jgi:hypothetical protein